MNAESLKQRERSTLMKRRTPAIAAAALLLALGGGTLYLTSDGGSPARADDDRAKVQAGKPTGKPGEPAAPAAPADGPGEPRLARTPEHSTLQPAADPRPARPSQTASLPKLTAQDALSMGRLEDKIGAKPHVKMVEIERGDTFAKVLLRAGVPKGEAYDAITAMRGVYDPRRLRAGRMIEVSFGVVGMEHNRFVGLRFDSAFNKRVSIQRQASGDFSASEVMKNLRIDLVRGDGTVEHSLFRAGLASGVPAAAMIRLIHLYSFNVDFQRDVRKGDKFEVLYRQYKDEDGKLLKSGDLVYASLALRGTVLKLYAYKVDGDHLFDYFDEKGNSNRRALMRTPIDGARLSSSFGYRRHPILGYNKLHTGIDFAAPTGTPIYAAGNGTIEMMGWYGGYGRYVRIRHNKTYHTAYAHMSRFKGGLSKGARVKQGQVIGYVGTTGRSTGPHLHYEILINGKHINPLTLKLPSGRKLKGKQLKKFLAWRKGIDDQFAKLGRKRGDDRVAATVSAPIQDGCVNGIRLDPSKNKPCD